MTSVSNVPAFNSSDSSRMVMAGMRKRKTKGARMKSPSSPAYPKSRMLNSSGKTQRNSPMVSSKTVSTMYPMRELRKPFISFFNSVSMPGGVFGWTKIGFFGER